LAILGGCHWPRHERARGYRIADEDDLEDPKIVGERPSPEEVERLYTALRKNHEDRNDRYGAHEWYWSEMEFGRRHAHTRLTYLARTFYRLTSDYGLSALRPACSLLAALSAAFCLYLISWKGICPVSGGSCVGWVENVKVVLLAVFLQPPPQGIALEGVAANVVWIILRVFGAAMLISIGVAFRNQVAR
jgi:hypothetical protein